MIVESTVLDGIEWVASMKILGVTLRRDLCVRSHLDEVLGFCAASLYAIRVLWAERLSLKERQMVAEDTTMTHLLYASPAWWGLATIAERQRLERFSAKLK